MKTPLALVLLLAAQGAEAQRTSQLKVRAEQVPGTLLQLNLKDLVVQAADRRVILMETAPDIRYAIHQEEGPPLAGTVTAFSAGDQIIIDAKIDSANRYHAERLQLEKKASAGEKAAASRMMNIVFGTTRGAIRLTGAESGDPLIGRARVAANNLSRSLPDFIVHQETSRYVGGTELKRHGRRLDVVSGDLVTENGAEKFQNVLVNGMPARGDPARSGPWSSGEYSTAIMEILAPENETKFEAKGSQTIARRRAASYSFAIDELHSRWQLFTPGQYYLPAFGGTIWFDEETGRVLKVEMESRSTPRMFPVEKAASSVEYDFVPLGNTTFLLPSRAKASTCMRGARCSTNEIVFRGYRKFAAESTISFDKEPR